MGKKGIKIGVASAMLAGTGTAVMIAKSLKEKKGSRKQMPGNSEYRNTERGRDAKNKKGIYYTSGNYEAFARPEKPEGVEGKSAYLVGGGLASLAAACFLVRDGQMPGSHIHILDWALHLDEGTPHIHERHVFDCKNRYGELCPQQEKALEELGVELPDPSKPKGKHNNRKQTFDAVCRTMLFDISHKHGVHLEQEPSYGGRAYLEKQDYILMKQKEQLAAQGQKLEELTLKIEDVDNLIDEVSSVAYDKAVELVTDEVKTMTHQEDIDMIEDTKVWLQSPERKAPKKERDYAVARLDGVVRRIRKAMQSTLEKMKAVLLHADKKKSITEEIKKQTKPSIVEALRRGMEEQRKKDSEKQAQEKQKKQNMEL